MANSIFNSDFDQDEEETTLSDYGYHEEGADDEKELEAEEDEEEKIEPEEGGETIFSTEKVLFSGKAKSLDEEQAEDDEIEEEVEEDNQDGVFISKTKIVLAKQLLENIQVSNEKLLSLFSGLVDSEDEARISITQLSEAFEEESASKIIEGVFDGENMIGPDGKEYAVPPNYASKSKLVEGDIMKLTITDRGTFVYKQTKPVDRRRLIGELEKDDEGGYFVREGRKKWCVLPASITYYKGIPGDKVVLLLPKTSESKWGAVDNVIKNK